MSLYSQMYLCIWTVYPQVELQFESFSVPDVVSDPVRLEASFLYRVAIPLKVP